MVWDRKTRNVFGVDVLILAAVGIAIGFLAARFFP
jgi:hypothetical protein